MTVSAVRSPGVPSGTGIQFTLLIVAMLAISGGMLIEFLQRGDPGLQPWGGNAARSRAECERSRDT